MLRIGFPGCKIGGLKVLELQRGLDRLDENGYENPSPGCSARFVPHPRGADRTSRPQDDDALAGRELALDDQVEGFSRRDFPVPPDRPTLRAERVGQRPRFVAIVVFITDEDVRRKDFNARFQRRR